MKDTVLLITGGGTGGHISPAIALYEDSKNYGVPVFFLTGYNDKRFAYISEIESDDLLFYHAPAFTKNILKLPFFILHFLYAFLSAVRIIRKNCITDVVGMGGYVSVPALLAAKMLSLPIWLCEQNTVPGKATRLFSKYAKNIFTTFDETVNFINPAVKDKLIVAGNPVRKKININYIIIQNR